MVDGKIYPSKVDGIRFLADPSSIDRNVAPNADIALGKPSLATTAVAGFAHIATCAGAPIGVPAQLTAGFAPMVYDTTNHKWWIYDGGWKGVVLA